MTVKASQRVDDHNDGMEIHRLLGQGDTMNISSRNFLMFALSLLLFGCVTPTAWVADPKVQTIRNPSYVVAFEPLKEEAAFFVYFNLSVSNRTDKDLMIDWNKTRYLRDGTAYGVFVFQGINPDDIRNQTIPPDTVPAGGTFKKEIAPYRLLARAPIRTRSSSAGKIEPGLIPVGRNGIRLVMKQDDNEIIETLHLTIDEQAVP
jgi:hypothetical protein